MSVVREYLINWSYRREIRRRLRDTVRKATRDDIVIDIDKYEVDDADGK